MSESKTLYPFRINDSLANTDDQTPESAKLLTDAGFEPPDDYLLIQRTQHGSRVVTTDETLDLTGGNQEFYAFQGGEAYEFTVNEHSVFWGASNISCEKAKYLSHVPADEELIWMRDGVENVILSADGSLELRPAGIEHLRSHKHPVQPTQYKYFVNGIEYTTELEEITGTQITSRVAGWNPADSLVLEAEGSAPDTVIHATTVVRLKGRTSPAHFTIVPPATFGER